MTKIFEQRKNFDLRRLLVGSERLIDNLFRYDSNKRTNDKAVLRNHGNLSTSDTQISLNSIIFIIFFTVTNDPFTFLTHSVRILPLSASVRETITSAIQINCSKIKNLVFAVLIAKNKLITLVRMKKYFIHPADLRWVMIYASHDDNIFL